MSNVIIDNNQEHSVQKVKQQLSTAIVSLIEKKQLKQKTIQEILGIKQPRVSDLVNCKIEKFSIDSLLDYLNKFGYSITEYQDENKDENKDEYINNIKTNIINSIVSITSKQRYKQKNIQEILDINQPRASDLINYKIEKFSIESLLEYLVKFGYIVKVGTHESIKSPISVYFDAVDKSISKSKFGKKYITNVINKKRTVE